jgi:hypothetical protein
LSPVHRCPALARHADGIRRNDQHAIDAGERGVERRGIVEIDLANRDAGLVHHGWGRDPRDLSPPTIQMSVVSLNGGDGARRSSMLFKKSRPVPPVEIAGSTTPKAWNGLCSLKVISPVRFAMNGASDKARR